MVPLMPSSVRQVHDFSNKWELCSRLMERSNDTWRDLAAPYGGAWAGRYGRLRKSAAARSIAEIGRLEGRVMERYVPMLHVFGVGDQTVEFFSPIVVVMAAPSVVLISSGIDR